MWLLGRGGQAALTLQRECVRWRGELMSLGVDERSPSAAEASEMTEGWREWQGLILTTAGCTTHRIHTHRYIDTVDKSPELVWETSRKKNLLLVCWVCTSNTKQRREREAGQMREPTLSVRGVSVVEGLLALTDGGSERQVSLHHPLLTPVHHGLRRHGQWVALRYVFCQGG